MMEMGLPFEEASDPFAAQVAENQQMLQETTGAVASVQPTSPNQPNMLPADFGLPSHLTATTPPPDEGGFSLAEEKLKDPDGGLTAAGRRHYKRTEGANLKPGVKNYSSASESDKKRWVRWALRFAGRSDIPPLKKPNGEPTRFALMFAAWGEPVPTSVEQVRKVHSKALSRRDELGMGESKKNMSASQPEEPSKTTISEVFSKVMPKKDKLSLASVYQRNLALSGEGDDGLIWKPVCKTGTLALSPGPGQVDSEKPLQLTPDLFDSVKVAYDDAAIEHVTIPETHGNGVLENTGYVKAVEVLDREQMLSDSRIPESSKRLVQDDPADTRYLMAGMRFTEPEVKEKVLRGTVANTSVGIKFNYRRKRDGKTYPAVLEHVALTNQPWVDGLVPFGQMMSRNPIGRRFAPKHSVYVDLDTAVAVEQATIEPPPMMNPMLTTSEDSPVAESASLSEDRKGVTIDDKQTTPTVRTRHRNMDKTVEELLASQQAELEAQQQRAAQLESELALAQGTINAQGEQLHRDRVAKRISQYQEEGVSPSVLQRAEAIMLADYSTGEGSLSLSISSGEESEQTFQSASDVVEYLLAAVPRGEDASGVAAVMNGLDALSSDKDEDDSVESKVDRIRNFISNGE